MEVRHVHAITLERDEPSRQRLIMSEHLVHFGNLQEMADPSKQRKRQMPARAQELTLRSGVFCGK